LEARQTTGPHVLRMTNVFKLIVTRILEKLENETKTVKEKKKEREKERKKENRIEFELKSSPNFCPTAR